MKATPAALVAFALLLLSTPATLPAQAPDIRLGIIGTDTSHVTSKHP